MKINQLMQQAQKMQETMKKAQEKIATMEVTGESGAGLVKVTMNGKHQIKKVLLDDSLLGSKDANDKELLEDLIAAACNDAVKKVGKETQEQMSGATGGMQLPEGLGNLFGK